ncbi:hypothetical protein CDL15_Pgr001362 [Punica granatum]|uniref:Uncharacterized protein n=1 Tax=Punica granatum TaxID=22663 RepID=A0A218WL68_PUNGR|nr:hypothetical protein CDL15_Pgr001362 [Punica granatum]PKI77314.1 hypothetical protein CRG98_002259 [Punica granatum]
MPCNPLLDDSISITTHFSVPRATPPSSCHPSDTTISSSNSLATRIPDHLDPSSSSASGPSFVLATAIVMLQSFS